MPVVFLVKTQVCTRVGRARFDPSSQPSAGFAPCFAHLAPGVATHPEWPGWAVDRGASPYLRRRTATAIYAVCSDRLHRRHGIIADGSNYSVGHHAGIAADRVA